MVQFIQDRADKLEALWGHHNGYMSDKRGAVAHIDIQYWTDKIWEYIPLIFTNTLIRP